MATPDVSHGRGGAGNINPDDTKYVDGEVVRAGVQGSHNDGAFSTGRGGAANIGDAGTHSSQRLDKDLVPDVAVRPSSDSPQHVGRGGAGNALNKEGDAVVPHKGLADKLKDMLRKIFK